VTVYALARAAACAPAHSTFGSGKAAGWSNSAGPLQVREQGRQRLDPLPALTRRDPLDGDALEVRIEHGGALLGKRRRAVVLFLPHRAVTFDPRTA
jgi:hypothetical protein